jgi:hypothetical protein
MRKESERQKGWKKKRMRARWPVRRSALPSRGIVMKIPIEPKSPA